MPSQLNTSGSWIPLQKSLSFYFFICMLMNLFYMVVWDVDLPPFSLKLLNSGFLAEWMTKFEERTTLHSFHCPSYFFFKYKEVNVKFCKSTVKKSQVLFNMFTCPGCSQPEDLEIQFCSQIETIFQFRSWFKYWQYDIFISLFVSENA